MFKINDNKKLIELNRGNIGDIAVIAECENKTPYIFKVNDVVRLSVYKKKDYNTLIFRKNVTVEEETSTVVISLTANDTKIGKIENDYVDYWYEIELNPETDTQTIIGHDENGPKIFRVYPEGDDE